MNEVRFPVFSKNQIVQTALLQDQGLNPTSSILLLASAGINISLPNLVISETAIAELLPVKEKLTEERNEYLLAVTKIANESYDRLLEGKYKDAFEWANNEAQFSIHPKAIELESQINKLDSKTKKNLGLSIWKDGIPAIGKGLADGGFKGAANAFGHEILKNLCGEIVKRRIEETSPLANYIVKLNRNLTS